MKHKNIKAIASLMLFFSATNLAGCAVQKAKGWDQYSKYMAAYDVLSEDCLKLNSKDLDYINYRKAASKLLTVMDVDSQLYNQTYKTIYTNSRTSTPEEKSRWCEQLRTKIIREADGMEGDYQLGLKVVDISRRERAEAWANVLEVTAAVMLGVAIAMESSYQSQFQQIGYIPMALPSVNFGSVSDRNVSNYLVNTPSGLRQCTVVSNYVNCYGNPP